MVTLVREKHTSTFLLYTVTRCMPMAHYWVGLTLPGFALFLDIGGCSKDLSTQQHVQEWLLVYHIGVWWAPRRELRDLLKVEHGLQPHGHHQVLFSGAILAMPHLTPSSGTSDRQNRASIHATGNYEGRKEDRPDQWGTGIFAKWLCLCGITTPFHCMHHNEQSQTIPLGGRVNCSYQTPSFIYWMWNISG